MPDHLPPGSGCLSLLAILRTGQTVEASGTALEVCCGVWSTEPELCEDGRATLLVRLPAGGALYLTRAGELLVVYRTEREGVFRAQLFSGSGEALWRAVAARHPGVTPGCGALPRYWVLRENVSPAVSTYASFDLLCFDVMERAGDRDAVARRVEAANSAGCAGERAA